MTTACLYMHGFFSIWLQYVYICLVSLVYDFTVFICVWFLWYMTALCLYSYRFYSGSLIIRQVFPARFFVFIGLFLVCIVLCLTLEASVLLVTSF